MSGNVSGQSRRSIARAMVIAAAAGIVCGLGASSVVLAQDEKRADPTTPTVTIDNFSFFPETLTVKAGAKVTFINHDDIPHTVVSVDKVFRSKALDTDDSYEFTFVNAGTFEYFCGLHPHMKAKIVVSP